MTRGLTKGIPKGQSAGYGQSPRSASPSKTAEWQRQRQAEVKALCEMMSARLQALSFTRSGQPAEQCFRNVAEAYAFIDADAEGGISEFELNKGLRQLRITAVDADQLMRPLDPMNRGNGTLTSQLFIRSFAFDGTHSAPALEAMLREAQLKRREVVARANLAIQQLADKDGSALQSAVSSLAQARKEMNAAHSRELRKLQDELRRCGFANPAEAYCFFDVDGGKSSVISHVDLVVGLRRLKIDHLFDLDVLQWALEGGGMRDNACMYSEWCRNVAWGEWKGAGIVKENAALDDANHRRRLIMRRVLAGVKERALAAWPEPSPAFSKPVPPGPHAVKIILNGRVLDNGKTLRDVHVASDAMVTCHLMVQVKHPPPSRSMVRATGKTSDSAPGCGCVVS